MKRAVLVAMLALGCMSHTERTTTARTPIATHVGPAVGDKSWVVAALEPRGNDLAIDVAQARLCRTFTDARVTERRVMEIRASGGRYAGAALLVLLGTLFVYYGNQNHERGTVSAGIGTYAGAVATWGLPLVAERDKVLANDTHRERSTGTPRPCIARRLADVRVTLRAGGTTHEATTDSAGHVVFKGVAVTTDLELFVEDMAVHDIRLLGIAGPARYPAAP